MPNSKLDKFYGFFRYLNDKFHRFNPSYLKCVDSIDKNLITNISNFPKFLDTLKHLIAFKLIIFVPEHRFLSYAYKHNSFIPVRIYENYIIPLAIFLDYFKIDVKTMPSTRLFIIPTEMYDNYYPNHGGDYCQGRLAGNNQCIHNIFVREHPLSIGNRKCSLITLFHESTHLIDNLHFNMIDHPDLIKYKLRWHEIKAHYISEVFYEFYAIASTYVSDQRKKLIAKKLNFKCAELDDLWIELSKLNYNVERNISFLKETKVIGTMLNNKNDQYIKSMDVIENIQLNFYELIEELE